VFEYAAQVTSVYDGDTFRADVDLGFNIWKFDEQFRLNRINTPEVKGVERPAGLVARSLFLTKLKVGDKFFLRTIKEGDHDKQEKYGRYLAEIYPNGFDDYCLNDFLVTSGVAKYYDGTGPKPV
jgi:micrococcal nuclease